MSANEHQVTICHATGSDENNPYVEITIAAAAVYNGHYGTGRGDHQDGDDIIPEFEYDGTTYPAQGDQSFLARDCKPATTTPTTSSPATSVSTTTTTQSTTTSRATQTTTTQTVTQAAPVVPQAKTTPPAQRTATATTPARRTAGPIPGAVAAGTNEAASWQLPVGGALILLGAVGMTTTVLRRKSARH